MATQTWVYNGLLSDVPNTWTDVDLSSVEFYDTHQRPISQKELKASIGKIIKNNIHL